MEECLRHVGTIANLHEKCKRYANWIIHHDDDVEAPEGPAKINMVGYLLATLFEADGVWCYETRLPATSHDRGILTSDAILDHLNAELGRQIQTQGITPENLNRCSEDLVQQLATLAKRRQVFLYRVMAHQLATGLVHILCGIRKGIFTFACSKDNLLASCQSVHWCDSAMRSNLQAEGGVSSLYFLEELQNSMSLGVMRRAEEMNPASDPFTFFNDYKDAALAFRNDICDQSLSPSLFETALAYIDEMIEHANLGIDILPRLSPQLRHSMQVKRAYHAGDDADEVTAADKEMPAPPTKKQRMDNYVVANNADTATRLLSAQTATSPALPLPQSLVIHAPLAISHQGIGFLSSFDSSPANTYVPPNPPTAATQSNAFDEPTDGRPQSIGTPGVQHLQQNIQSNVSNQSYNEYQVQPLPAHPTNPGLAQSLGFGVPSISTPVDGAPILWSDFDAGTEGNEFDESNSAQDDYT
jgi:hypothetical protein